MEIVYGDKETEKVCTNLNEAKRYFGGNALLARSLLARITALKQAENIKDIVVQRQFRFHKLENRLGRDLDGYFAIDVKSHRDQWRIILQPLDENTEPYVAPNIDEIAQAVKVVEIMEVSKHYE